MGHPDVFEFNLEHETQRVLLTGTIGSTYFEDWFIHAFPSWKEYALRNGAGIVAVRAPTSNAPTRLPLAWYKAFLPEHIMELHPSIRQVALLDSDVIISPTATDIFSFHEQGTIGVISQFNLPFDRELALRKLAFFRNFFFDPSYPLDSSLHAPVEKIYSDRNLPHYRDHFCAGVMTIDGLETSRLLASWVREADLVEATAIATRTGQWEQPYLNHKVYSAGLNHELPYSFQGLWTLEAALKAPQVFEAIVENDWKAVEQAVEFVMMDLDFLHFAGSWPESQVWKKVLPFSDPRSIDLLVEWRVARETELTGNARGPIKPSSSLMR